jgi:hypothetical protein
MPYDEKDAKFDAEQKGEPICPKCGTSDCGCCEECGASDSEPHERWCGEYEPADEYVDEFDDEEAYMVKRFRDPGGRSALHPGERNHPCPTCGRANALTDADVASGYQCDSCADRAEGTYMGADY